MTLTSFHDRRVSKNAHMLWRTQEVTELHEFTILNGSRGATPELTNFTEFTIFEGSQDVAPYWACMDISPPFYRDPEVRHHY